jgi:hypothetical protein
VTGLHGQKVGVMPTAERPVDVQRERHGAHPESHRRAGCSETGTSGSGRGPLEKEPHPCGNLASGLPVQPPNEQCWVMRSVGLVGLVRARPGVERCA